MREARVTCRTIDLSRPECENGADGDCPLFVREKRDCTHPRAVVSVPVGLLKNPMSEKMAIETKRVSLANFAQMALFQQPPCPRFRRR